MARARAGNLDARALATAKDEAGQRVAQARAGYLPRVDVVEGWQRGNHPVFVFSSLLAQRAFAAENFAVDTLNHPAATDNFRLALTAEQTIFDPALAARTRAARVAEQLSQLDAEQLDRDLGVIVTEAFGRVLSAIASRNAAASAIELAETDLRIARDRRDAGRVTDADVLLVEVHLARARERQIRAAADEQVARATLNQLMGEPLDVAFELGAGQDVAPVGDDTGALEAEALANRVDVKAAVLNEQLAEASISAARAAFLPSFSLQTGWEANGGSFGDRSSSWAVGISGRVNLFSGLGDRARLAEARLLATRRALERESAQSKARLEVRRSRTRLDAARAAAEVGRATAAQARESRRIVRDRYEAGLADIGALLRAADAVTEADALETTARIEVFVATAALSRALGRS